ncbi:uncharacterized protein METZ01_LOCUS144899 [marine metagenome]|uniref:Uncharacterized protein n=1 Tax=marine metagenome TaxID=408172 RepID=A0A381ZRZ8_9ZZZZ
MEDDLMPKFEASFLALLKVLLASRLIALFNESLVGLMIFCIVVQPEIVPCRNTQRNIP